MYVYGDMSTDARVQRAATALGNSYNVIVISNLPSKTVPSSNYDNFFIKRKHGGLRGLMEALRTTIKLIKDENPDLIYCHDYYSALLAWWLLLFYKKIPVVYDAHELIIPDEKEKNRRLAFFRWFEKRIVRKVDLLICASEQRGGLMKNYYNLKDLPLVIPNVSHLVITQSEDTQEVLLQLEGFFKHPEPTIVYAGVVVKGRGLDKLIDAVIELLPKYKLLIVGDGDAREELEQKVQHSEGLISAFTGKVSYHALGAILSKCDVGYVFYPNTTLNNRYCASNKIYEYASVRLPMVSNNNPTLKQILEENSIGISSDNIQESLETVLSREEEFKKSCDLFNELNNWQKYAALLNKRINEALL